jgi:hypothetical protein
MAETPTTATTDDWDELESLLNLETTLTTSLHPVNQQEIDLEIDAIFEEIVQEQNDLRRRVIEAQEKLRVTTEAAQLDAVIHRHHAPEPISKVELGKDEPMAELALEAPPLCGSDLTTANTTTSPVIIPVLELLPVELPTVAMEEPLQPSNVSPIGSPSQPTDQHRQPPHTPPKSSHKKKKRFPISEAPAPSTALLGKAASGKGRISLWLLLCIGGAMFLTLAIIGARFWPKTAPTQRQGDQLEQSSSSSFLTSTRPPFVAHDLIEEQPEEEKSRSGEASESQQREEEEQEQQLEFPSSDEAEQEEAEVAGQQQKAEEEQEVPLFGRVAEQLEDQQRENEEEQGEEEEFLSGELTEQQKEGRDEPMFGGVVEQQGEELGEEHQQGEEHGEEEQQQREEQGKEQGEEQDEEEQEQQQQGAEQEQQEESLSGGVFKVEEIEEAESPSGGIFEQHAEGWQVEEPQSGRVPEQEEEEDEEEQASVTALNQEHIKRKAEPQSGGVAEHSLSEAVAKQPESEADSQSEEPVAASGGGEWLAVLSGDPTKQEAQPSVWLLPLLLSLVLVSLVVDSALRSQRASPSSPLPSSTAIPSPPFLPPPSPAQSLGLESVTPCPGEEEAETAIGSADGSLGRILGTSGADGPSQAGGSSQSSGANNSRRRVPAIPLAIFASPPPLLQQRKRPPSPPLARPRPPLCSAGPIMSVREGLSFSLATRHRSSQE